MFKYKKTIAFIIILAVAGGYFFYAKSRKTTITYTTAKVSRENLAQTVSVSGKIASPNEIDLAFEKTGRLADVYVSVGDKVSAGQLVAQIEPGTLLHERNQFLADLKMQKETLENMKKKRSVYTQEQRDAQRALIEKAQSLIAGAEKRISETKIYAPIDAMVGRRNFDSGETAMAGTAVLTLFQNTDLEVTANIPESDIIKIKLGQKADLTLDAFPVDAKLSAEVFEIEPSSTVIQDVVYYKIKLKLEKQDEQIKPGMSVNIDVRTNEKQGVLMLPLRAIKIKNGEKFVDVLKENNLTEELKITTGLEGDAGMVEIKSGVKEGDSVVTFSKPV
ncbi:MAG: efflux RND transporter periplasmic adaptor subunit [Candidatus Moraniibacteriota bacterium]